MNNILQTQKNLKKKLSLDDYSSTTETSDTPQTPTTASTYVAEGPAHTASQTTHQKIKATYYLTEADHGALTQVYIKRLQNKQKTDRSALISEAIRLLYSNEMK
jgi:hypothetical protein